jgi:hypothetical protein
MELPIESACDDMVRLDASGLAILEASGREKSLHGKVLHKQSLLQGWSRWLLKKLDVPEEKWPRGQGYLGDVPDLSLCCEPVRR